MKCHRVTGTLLVLSAVCCGTSFGFDFDCAGAKRLVKTLALGPDGLTDKLAADPEKFVDGHVIGWKCVPQPFPPQRDNRAYVEELECFRSDDKAPVSDDDLAAAGKTYKKNLKDLYGCFEGQIDATPITYGNTSRGEKLRVVVGQYVKDGNGKPHHILIEYGYVQDGSGPIFWTISAMVGGAK